MMRMMFCNDKQYMFSMMKALKVDGSDFSHQNIGLVDGGEEDDDDHHHNVFLFLFGFSLVRFYFRYLSITRLIFSYVSINLQHFTLGLLVRSVLGSIPRGGPTELFLVPASASQLVQHRPSYLISSL